MIPSSFNLKDIEAAVDFIMEDLGDNLVEMRLMSESNGKLIGFFNEREALIASAKKASGSFQVYVSLNHRRPTANKYEKSNHLFPAKRDFGGKNSDVDKIRKILIDIECRRGKEIPASAQEIDRAGLVTDQIAKCLFEKFSIECSKFLSGNGFHLIFRVNLKKNSETDGKIRKFLTDLGKKFDDADISIDTSVHDPARVCKLYGTMSVKGTASVDRPHRLAKVLKICDSSKIFDVPNLISTSKKTDVAQDPNANVFAIIKSSGLYIRQKSEDMHIIRCPWSASHTTGTDGDTSTIYHSANEQVPEYFNCKHSHCSNKKLTDLKAHLGIKNSRVAELAIGEFKKGDDESPYPIDALGELKNIVLELHHSIKVPISMAAQIVLNATNAVTQGLFDLGTDHISGPTSLFFLTVAESGERKTSASRAIFQPHYEFEKSLFAKYDDEVKKNKARMESANLAKKAARSKGPQLIEESKAEHVDRPIKPNFMVDDITIQGLYKSFDYGYPIKNFFTPEAGTLIGGFAMSKENRMMTMAGLSKFWDGGTFSTVRAKDEAHSRVSGKRLSVHLMAQPSVVNDLINDEMAKTQGFLARFLIAFPKSLIGTRELSKNCFSKSAAFNSYSLRMSEILKLLPASLDPGSQELSLPPLQLNEEAKKVFAAFYNKIERGSAEGAEFYVIKEFSLKCPEILLRLSSTLAGYKNPREIFLDAKSVEDAVILMDYFLAERLRIHRKEFIDIRESELETLMQFLSRFGGNETTSQFILQRGPAFVRKSEVLQKFMKNLEMRGHVEPVNASHAKPTKWRVFNVTP